MVLTSGRENYILLRSHHTPISIQAGIMWPFLRSKQQGVEEDVEEERRGGGVVE